jgi:hypothetical protein
MAHLTKIEQETVITFNAAEKTAHVQTFMRRIITKLDKNPNAKVLDRSMFGDTEGVTYELPVNCISFRRGKLGLMDELDGEGAPAAAAKPKAEFKCPFKGCDKTLGSLQGIKTHHLKVHGKEYPTS